LEISAREDECNFDDVLRLVKEDYKRNGYDNDGDLELYRADGSKIIKNPSSMSKFFKFAISYQNHST